MLAQKSPLYRKTIKLLCGGRISKLAKQVASYAPSNIGVILISLGMSGGLTATGSDAQAQETVDEIYDCGDFISTTLTIGCIAPNYPNGIAYNNINQNQALTINIGSTTPGSLSAPNITYSIDIRISDDSTNDVLIDFLDGTLNTSSLSAHGISVANAGTGMITARLSGGSIQILAENTSFTTGAYGIFSFTNNQSNSNHTLAEVKGGTVITAGDYSYAVYAQSTGTSEAKAVVGGDGTMIRTGVNDRDGTASGGGISAVGVSALNSGLGLATVEINTGATVTTLGQLAHGMRAYVSNSFSSATAMAILNGGRVITAGRTAYGINVVNELNSTGDVIARIIDGTVATGYILNNANEIVAADTDEEDAYGVFVFSSGEGDARVEATGGTIIARSQNAYGIYAESLSGDVVVDLSSNIGSISNGITSVTGGSGTGAAIYTNARSGTATIMIGDNDLVDGNASGIAIKDEVSNAQVTISGANIDGQIDLGAGDDSLNMNSADISDVTGFAGGAGTDAITFNNIIYTTAVNNFTDWEELTLQGTTELTLTNAVSLTLRSLVHTSGTLSMEDSNANNRITVNDGYTTGGTLVVDVDFASELADRLIVNSVSGDQATTIEIAVLATATEATIGDGILIVDVIGTDAVADSAFTFADFSGGFFGYTIARGTSTPDAENNFYLIASVIENDPCKEESPVATAIICTDDYIGGSPNLTFEVNHDLSVTIGSSRIAPTINSTINLIAFAPSIPGDSLGNITVNFENGNLDTSDLNGRGIYLMTTFEGTTSTGENRGAATATVVDGTIKTKGDGEQGVYVFINHSGNLSDAKIMSTGSVMTAGENAHSLYAYTIGLGNVIIKVGGGMVQTSGTGTSLDTGAYGLYSYINNADNAAQALAEVSDGSVIIGGDYAIAVFAQTNGSGEARATISGANTVIRTGVTNVDGTIESADGGDNAFGVYALNEGIGAATAQIGIGSTISTVGDAAHGVVAEIDIQTSTVNTAAVTINSTGSITTTGVGSRGLYATTDSTGVVRIMMRGGTVQTSGAGISGDNGAHGLYSYINNANNAAQALVDISNGLVRTSGNYSIGVYAHTTGTGMATVEVGEGSTISVSGTNSSAIKAEIENANNSAAVSINNNAVITSTGGNSYGLYATTDGTGAATVTMRNGTVQTTSGASSFNLGSHAVYSHIDNTENSEQALAEVSGGAVITGGANSFGVYATNRGSGEARVRISGSETVIRTGASDVDGAYSNTIDQAQSGPSAYAIFALANGTGDATAIVDGSMVTTFGSDAHAIYAHIDNENSTATATAVANNVTVLIDNHTSYGVYASNAGRGETIVRFNGGLIVSGSIEVENGAVEAIIQGDGTYTRGLYASSLATSGDVGLTKVEVTSGTIVATGLGSYGIYARSLSGDVEVDLASEDRLILISGGANNGAGIRTYTPAGRKATIKIGPNSFIGAGRNSYTIQDGPGNLYLSIANRTNGSRVLSGRIDAGGSVNDTIIFLNGTYQVIAENLINFETISFNFDNRDEQVNAGAHVIFDTLDNLSYIYMSDNSADDMLTITGDYNINTSSGGQLYVDVDFADNTADKMVVNGAINVVSDNIFPSRRILILVNALNRHMVNGLPITLVEAGRVAEGDSTFSLFYSGSDRPPYKTFNNLDYRLEYIPHTDDKPAVLLLAHFSDCTVTRPTVRNLVCLDESYSSHGIRAAVSQALTITIGHEYIAPRINIDGARSPVLLTMSANANEDGDATVNFINGSISSSDESQSGIRIDNQGRGDTAIGMSGGSISMTGIETRGLSATTHQDGSTTVTMNGGTITMSHHPDVYLNYAARGINAISRGDGDITVTMSKSSIIMNNNPERGSNFFRQYRDAAVSRGISAVAEGTGDINITLGGGARIENLVSVVTGIYAFAKGDTADANENGGAVNITLGEVDIRVNLGAAISSGTIYGSRAIWAQSDGGDIVIDLSDPAAAIVFGYQQGIYTSSSAGSSVTITIGANDRVVGSSFSYDIEDTDGNATLTIFTDEDLFIDRNRGLRLFPVIGRINGGGGEDTVIFRGDIHEYWSANLIDWERYIIGDIDAGDTNTYVTLRSPRASGTSTMEYLEINTGTTLSLVDGDANDNVTVSDDYNGGGTLVLDVDFVNNRADTLSLPFSAESTAVMINVVQQPVAVTSGDGILIIDITNTDAVEDSAFVFAGGDNNERYNYAITRGTTDDTANNFYLTSTIILDACQLPLAADVSSLTCSSNHYSSGISKTVDRTFTFNIGDDSSNPNIVNGLFLRTTAGDAVINVNNRQGTTNISAAGDGSHGISLQSDNGRVFVRLRSTGTTSITGGAGTGAAIYTQTAANQKATIIIGENNTITAGDGGFAIQDGAGGAGVRILGATIHGKIDGGGNNNSIFFGAGTNAVLPQIINWNFVVFGIDRNNETHVTITGTDNRVDELSHNTGTLSLQNDDATDRLNVSGLYTGGGTLVLDVDFVDDSTDGRADRLIVNNINATFPTTVRLNILRNATVSSRNNGILIVEVTGNAIPSSTAFVFAGATSDRLAYSIHQVNNDFYLRVNVADICELPVDSGTSSLNCIAENYESGITQIVDGNFIKTIGNEEIAPNIDSAVNLRISSGNAVLHFKNGNIIDEGISLINTGTGAARITVSGGNIKTTNSFAIRNQIDNSASTVQALVNINDGSVITSDDSAIAVYVTNNGSGGGTGGARAIISGENTIIRTGVTNKEGAASGNGHGAHAVFSYVTGQGSAAIEVGTGSTVSTLGRNAHGIFAQVSNANNTSPILVTNSGTINTAQSNAHGIHVFSNARGEIQAEINDGGTVSSSAHGIYVRLINAANTETVRASNSGTINSQAQGIHIEANHEGLAIATNSGTIRTYSQNRNGVFVMNLGNGGAISMITGGSIETSGHDSHALISYVTSNSSTGAASVMASGGTIRTRTGAGYALYALTNGSGQAIITMSGGSVETLGDVSRALTGSRGLTRGAYALYAAIESNNNQNQALVHVTGGSVVTEGDYAFAVYAKTNGSGEAKAVISGENTRIRTGVNLDGSSRVKGGNSYGVYAHATNTAAATVEVGAGSEIHTLGNNAYGIYVYISNAANSNVATTTNAATATNAGTVITSGTSSYGMYVLNNGIGATRAVNSGTIRTAQSNAHGIHVLSSNGRDEIQAEMNDGSIITSGNDAHGIYVTSTEGDAVIRLIGGTVAVVSMLNDNNEIIAAENDDDKSSSGLYVHSESNRRSAVIQATGGTVIAHGDNSNGIYAQSTSGNVVINFLAPIASGRNGATSITTFGNGAAAIRTETAADRRVIISIGNGDTISTNASNGFAIRDGIGDAYILFASGANISGNVVLGMGNDSITISGANVDGVGLFDGGHGLYRSDDGLDNDTITFDSGTRVSTDLLGWETVIVDGENTQVIVTNTFVTDNLRILKNAEFLIQTPNAVSNNIINGNVDNFGTINMQDGDDLDTLTITGDYRSGSILAVDVGNTTSDVIRVIGNSSTTSGEIKLVMKQVASPSDATEESTEESENNGAIRIIPNVLQFDNPLPEDTKVRIINDDPTMNRELMQTINEDGSSSFSVRNTPASNLGDAMSPETEYQRVYSTTALALQRFNVLSTKNQRLSRRQAAGHDGVAVNVLSNEDQTQATNRISNGSWVYISGNRTDLGFAGGTDIKNTIWGIQGGVDFTLGNDLNQWILGMNVQYGRLDTSTSTNSGNIGGIKTTGYGVGITSMWHNAYGTYFDGQLQLNWLDSDIVVDGDNRSSGVDSKAYAFSIEGGHRFVVGENKVLIPQAQISWGRVDSNKFTDSIGRVIDMSDNRIVGRLGLAYEFSFDAGQAYIIGNLLHDFSGGESITAIRTTPNNSYNFKVNGEKTWGEIGIGGSINFGNMSISGEVSYQRSFNNSKDVRGLGGTIGINFRW